MVLIPGQGRDHDHPRLGLPPRVDDRAALAADVLVVPDPRLGVDRLADRPEQPQLREVVLRRVLRAPLHVRPDRGRGRVEDGDAVALGDRPTTGPCRGSPAFPRTSPTWRRCRAARRRCSCDPSPSRRRLRTSTRRCRASGRRCSGASSRRRRDSRRSCARSPSAWRSCPTCRADRADPRDPSAPPGTVTRRRRARATSGRGPRSSARRCRCAAGRSRSRPSARRRPPRRRCA